MRWLIALLVFPLAALGQQFTFAWDNQATWPVNTTVELLINGTNYPGLTGTTAIIDAPILPGETLQAKARAVPPTGWQCLVNDNQDLTLCHEPYQVSTTECPLKACEPSAYSNQVAATIPVAPTNLIAYKTWLGTDPIPSYPVLNDVKSTTYNTTSISNATGIINALSGDLLVAVVASDNSFAVPTITSSPILTWTKRQEIIGSGFESVAIYTATATGALTATFNRIGATEVFGGTVYAFTNTTGLGNSAKNNPVAQGAPSVQLPVSSHSAVVLINADWTANQSAYSFNISPGPFLEKSVSQNSIYGAYTGYYPDIVNSGTYTFGMLMPNNQKYSIAAIEIKGK
jgi:hypothetical protein